MLNSLPSRTNPCRLGTMEIRTPVTIITWKVVYEHDNLKQLDRGFKELGKPVTIITCQVVQ